MPRAQDALERLSYSAHDRRRPHAREVFCQRRRKFIRLLLDNACDSALEKNSEKFFAARIYPQKRWKTSG